MVSASLCKRGGGLLTVPKPRIQIVVVQVPADKDEARVTCFVSPFPNIIAFQHHVDGLHDKLSVLTLNRQNSFGSEDIATLAGEQILQPVFQTCCIKRSIAGQRNAGDACIVDVIVMVVSGVGG